MSDLSAKAIEERIKNIKDGYQRELAEINNNFEQQKAASTLSCTESVIFDVISAALTGVTKNNEKIRANLFIFLKQYGLKIFIPQTPLTRKMIAAILNRSIR